MARCPLSSWAPPEGMTSASGLPAIQPPPPMTFSLRLLAFASILAISTALSAPSANAQPYLVRSQISATSDFLASRGLYRTHETIYDDLWDKTKCIAID